MKNRSDEIVSKIIGLYASRRFPIKREGEFNAWFVSQVHRKEKDRALEELWNETVGIDPRPGEETREAFRKLASRLGIEQASADGNGRAKVLSGPRTAPVKIRRMRPLGRIAAVLVPLILLGSALFFFTRESVAPLRKEGPADVTITALHAPREILLPDSSRLWINTGSRVRYKREFRDGRLIELLGEGYFDVTRNPERPFKITTGEMSVTVLGTEFNISAYPDAPETAVSLYVGRVRIDRNGESYILDARQELVYSEQQERTEIYDLHAVKPGWLAQPVEFTYIPLSEILRQTAQKFEVEIGDLPAGVPDDTLSIYLDGTEGLEETLFRLAKLSGKFGFRIRGDRVIIENN